MMHSVGQRFRIALRSALSRRGRRVRHPREWVFEGALLCVMLVLAAGLLPLWAELPLALASLVLVRFAEEVRLRRSEPRARPSQKAGLS
jgi:hypothetical protein